MAEKTFNSRIIHKHDIEANWLLATNFIPKQGEIIVYDIDENYSYERMKIGDGTHVVNELPFVINAITIAEIEEICGIFNPETAFVDFVHIDNGNGTYTLTSWKGTLNGEPSTELVIPNFEEIIV